MLWFCDHQRTWHLVILVMLGLAIFGPWAFDLLYVPAEFSCSPPIIRLEGDFCGVPLSGAWLLKAMVSELNFRVDRLTAGAATIPDVAVGFKILVGILLLLLPFFSTLLLVLTGYRRFPQIFIIVVWGAAAGFALWVGLSRFPKPYWVLWGLWLYIGISMSMLVMEGFVFARGRSTSTGSRITT